MVLAQPKVPRRLEAQPVVLRVLRPVGGPHVQAAAQLAQVLEPLSARQRAEVEVRLLVPQAVEAAQPSAPPEVVAERDAPREEEAVLVVLLAAVEAPDVLRVEEAVRVAQQAAEAAQDVLRVAEVERVAQPAVRARPSEARQVRPWEAQLSVARSGRRAPVRLARQRMVMTSLPAPDAARIERQRSQSSSAE